MSDEELFWLDAAAGYRAERPWCGRPQDYLDWCAAMADRNANLCALDGLDLSLDTITRPTAGDALALRGEVL